MRIVQKYGGTSLADGERMRKAAERAAKLARQGNQVAVVVSAQGDTTDDLLERAAQINPQPSRRELDAYLACGEQLSASLMAMAVQYAGRPAVSLTGWQAGIRTDSTAGNARIQQVEPRRILEEWERGNVVIVAGFQGLDDRGNITTLGRGGSDTTAAALAAALKADRCQIFTDVDGIYDRDPRRFPNARKFDAIGYEQMLSMARSGAQVLHDRCVELARDNGVRLEVLSAFTDAPGTMVG